ncbi:hypothetical protein OUZ56_008851 [Daphnia magna]|uniref:Uncharacterized protein n=1 Tax=Daphnia magna TaxID=35525 RepID=A0ABR0AEG9_9CRUS|nr:hypothetical protein OUZ56_008851 [Daphnia magna]
MRPSNASHDNKSAKPKGGGGYEYWLLRHCLPGACRNHRANESKQEQHLSSVAFHIVFSSLSVMDNLTFY